MTDTVAARIGSLWYVGMIVAGTIAAGLLARETKNRAFLVCVPPAFAVFGGAFVHVTEIAVALPATMLALAYAKGASRTMAIIALLSLASRGE